MSGYDVENERKTKSKHLGRAMESGNHEGKKKQCEAFQRQHA